MTLNEATARAMRDAAIAEMEAKIDELERPIRRAVIDAIRREATLDYFARARILAALDPALTQVYGAYPGDPNAALSVAILDEATILASQVEAAS